MWKHRSQFMLFQNWSSSTPRSICHVLRVVFNEGVELLTVERSLWTTDMWRCRWLFFLKLDVHLSQAYGLSSVCRILMCSVSPLRNGKAAPHWSHRKFLSFLWILRTCLLRFPLCFDIEISQTFLLELKFENLEMD